MGDRGDASSDGESTNLHDNDALDGNHVSETSNKKSVRIGTKRTR
jgi:hypothetical protein